ncbi:MAG: thermonuclease family protein [Nitrospira sp.]
MLLIWLLAPLLAQGEFVGTVLGVIDGDSLRVMHEGTAEQIRLLGVDCPEERQAFGTRAKEYTSELAFGQDVTVYGDKRDRYGRRLAEVLLPDGRSLNQELIKAGLAWWFRKYSKDLRLGELEPQAREAKRGLWAEPNPVPPWEWTRPRS